MMTKFEIADAILQVIGQLQDVRISTNQAEINLLTRSNELLQAGDPKGLSLLDYQHTRPLIDNLGKAIDKYASELHNLALEIYDIKED
jgi:hypothetical protein